MITRPKLIGRSETFWAHFLRTVGLVTLFILLKLEIFTTLEFVVHSEDILEGGGGLFEFYSP